MPASSSACCSRTRLSDMTCVPSRADEHRRRGTWPLLRPGTLRVRCTVPTSRAAASRCAAPSFCGTRPRRASARTHRTGQRRGGVCHKPLRVRLGRHLGAVTHVWRCSGARARARGGHRGGAAWRRAGLAAAVLAGPARRAAAAPAPGARAPAPLRAPAAQPAPPPPAPRAPPRPPAACVPPCPCEMHACSAMCALQLLLAVLRNLAAAAVALGLGGSVRARRVTWHLHALLLGHVHGGGVLLLLLGVPLILGQLRRPAAPPRQHAASVSAVDDPSPRTARSARDTAAASAPPPPPWPGCKVVTCPVRARAAHCCCCTTMDCSSAAVASAMKASTHACQSASAALGV